jgi:hypothetical protein
VEEDGRGLFFSVSFENFLRELRNTEKFQLEYLILSTVKPVVIVKRRTNTQLTSLLLRLSTLSSLLWSSVQTVCEERFFINPAYN